MNARAKCSSRPLVAAVVALLAFTPLAAHAQCTYLSPPAWQTIGFTGNPAFGRVPGSAMKSNWTVVALRPLAGDDWDMQLYSASAASPTCVGGTLLANSTYGGAIVDFVIGDGTTNAHTDVYPRWYYFSGTGQPRVAWTDSSFTLVPNQTIAWNWFAPDTLVQVYQFHLTAGVSYEIGFDQSGNSGGTMGATAHLFRNPGTGTYWAGRGGALATFSAPGAFTAPTTGTYALVVCNDARAQGQYSLKVWSCPAPVALVNRTYTPVGGIGSAYTISPGTAHWGVVGFSGDNFATPELFRTQAGGAAPPGCFTNHLLWLDGSYEGYSYDAYQLGVVNFDEAGTQPFYLSLERAAPQGPYDSYPYVTWDAGSTTLAVDGPQVTGYMGPGIPGVAYDVYLVAGTTYHIHFRADLGDEWAIPYVLLFRPQGSQFYNTSMTVLKLAGAGDYTFTAPATGWYGAIVTGPAETSSGPYALAFGSAACPFPTLVTTGVPASLPSPNGYVRYDSDTEWALFAARGATTADDWDLAVSESPTGAASPTCIGPVAGSSNYGTTAIDFVAVYKRRNYFDDPPTHWYARANRISAGSTPATLVTLAPRALHENDPTRVDTLDSNELAHFYTVYLSGGTTYNFEFTRLTTGVTVHLLGPDGSGSGFGRPVSLVSTTTNFTYTTPATSGTYALVVANNDLVGGGYRLRFGSCLAPFTIPTDTPYQAYWGTHVYSVPQTQAAWSAYGVRYGAADWDVAAAPASSTAWPSCLSGAGATSSLSTTHFTDFVVTDFHHVTPATWYAKPYQYAPAPLETAWAEWSPATGVLANEPFPPQETMTTNDVLRCHEVHLTAGVTYTISFGHLGSADLHLLMFRNPGTGAYWAPRSAAVVNVAPGGEATYTAPVTDDYAIVVVNDNGLADSYGFSVNYCPAPVALTNGVPVSFLPQGFTSFTPSTQFWNAVGVRGSGDWDLMVYGAATGGISGECFGSLRGASNAVLVADFIVGDFNAGANPLGTYYARPYRFDQVGSGAVEWAMGTSVLLPGAAPATRNTSAADIVETWDANLIAGQAYNVYFTHRGDADVKAFIFSNPGGAYWAPRVSAVWQGTGHGTFVPTRSGWHGVVVANDNGLAGSYDIGLSLGGLDAPPAVPMVTALRGAAPNPMRTGTTIEYALHEGANVKLEVLDMAGRRVATLEDGERPAGTYRVPWTRAGGVAPGLYFVRLQVAGRTVGEKKVALVQ